MGMELSLETRDIISPLGKGWWRPRPRQDHTHSEDAVLAW